LGIRPVRTSEPRSERKKIKKNTRNYKQHYGFGSYDRLYVPRRYEISFAKSDFCTSSDFLFRNV
jgi:hypothetical protein